MNIVDYLERVNKETQEIFSETIKNPEPFGKAHHLSACVFEFSELLNDTNEKELLATVSAQIEYAYLNLALGLYRQAFSSLRLAFEMGLGAVYFSINKMEHFEWLNGKKDIKWSKLIDVEDGILSTRFSDAFFPELTPIMPEYNERAKKVYRKLSEFVHGNSETWTKSGIQITFNGKLISEFFSHLYETAEIILFALSCRYLKSTSVTNLEALEFVRNEFNHVAPIRVLFGGPKE